MIWDILGCIALYLFATALMAPFIGQCIGFGDSKPPKRQPDGMCRHVFADREGSGGL